MGKIVSVIIAINNGDKKKWKNFSPEKKVDEFANFSRTSFILF